jgi:hypothetical protein
MNGIHAEPPAEPRHPGEDAEEKTSSPRLWRSCTSHGVIAPVSIPMRALSPA